MYQADIRLEQKFLTISRGPDLRQQDVGRSFSLHGFVAKEETDEIPHQLLSLEAAES